MFEEEFRTYDIDAPEVRALQRAMPPGDLRARRRPDESLAAGRHASPPRPRRGFAFQAPPRRAPSPPSPGSTPPTAATRWRESRSPWTCSCAVG